MLGLAYRLRSLAGFVHPTYGNTMYHTGMIRLIAENGFMPIYDLSYGAFTKSFYVPAYRLFAASLSILSSNDAMVTASLFVIALGLITIFVVYLFGKEIGGAAVGLTSALLLVLSPELTIYTIRAFPQVLGIPFFILTLYFLKKNDRTMCVLSAILTTMSHQTTAVALAAVLIVYGILKRDKTSFIALFASGIVYGLWQLYALETIDILGMRQIALKESGKVTAMNVERIGAFALLFAPFGLVKILRDYKKHLLLISFIIATLILSKNDLLGIGIFTDRLFTFFALSVIILAGIGMSELWKLLEGARWK